MDEEYWSILTKRDKDYYIDNVSLLEVAQQFATPLYVYSANYIRRQYQRYCALSSNDKPISIHYAVKANSNLHILALLAELGAGFDVVSIGEIERVVKVGGDASRIIFSGVGKTDADIKRALSLKIGCFNVESAFELEQIIRIAQDNKCVAPIALRVNPNVDAKTHPYISTGLKENKFGIALEDAYDLYMKASQYDCLDIKGVGCHIGSQITTLDPFMQALDSLIKLCDQLIAAGIRIKHLDIGGGLGISVPQKNEVPDIEILVEYLQQRLGSKPYQLQLQPGRSIVGNAGVLLTRVISHKEQQERRFIVVDAAMNDYIRPALYQAYPAVKNLSADRDYNHNISISIVGPVCESADVFIKDVELGAQENDLLAFSGVGAYGMTMSSQYNSRLRPAEVLIDNGNARLIRRRDKLEELWEQEIDL